MKKAPFCFLLLLILAAPPAWPDFFYSCPKVNQNMADIRPALAAESTEATASRLHWMDWLVDGWTLLGLLEKLYLEEQDTIQVWFRVADYFEQYQWASPYVPDQQEQGLLFGMVFFFHQEILFSEGAVK